MEMVAVATLSRSDELIMRYAQPYYIYKRAGEAQSALPPFMSSTQRRSKLLQADAVQSKKVMVAGFEHSVQVPLDDPVARLQEVRAARQTR
jgi:hypothetical protein